MDDSAATPPTPTRPPFSPPSRPPARSVQVDRAVDDVLSGVFGRTPDGREPVAIPVVAIPMVSVPVVSVSEGASESVSESVPDVAPVARFVSVIPSQHEAGGDDADVRRHDGESDEDDGALSSMVLPMAFVVPPDVVPRPEAGAGHEDGGGESWVIDAFGAEPADSGLDSSDGDRGTSPVARGSAAARRTGPKPVSSRVSEVVGQLVADAVSARAPRSAPSMEDVPDYDPAHRRILLWLLLVGVRVAAQSTLMPDSVEDVMTVDTYSSGTVIGRVDSTQRSNAMPGWRAEEMAELLGRCRVSAGVPLQAAEAVCRSVGGRAVGSADGHPPLASDGAVVSEDANAAYDAAVGGQRAEGRRRDGLSPASPVTTPPATTGPVQTVDRLGRPVRIVPRSHP